VSSEFWAAIAGAILGGCIAATLQWITLRASAKERKQTALERDQADARALLFKIIKIQSDFQNIFSALKEMRDHTKPQKMPFDWQTCVPLANLPREVEFSSSEMSVLLKAKDNDLFNDVVSLDHVHSGIIQNLELYRSKRQALTDSLPADMEGEIGTTRGNDDLRRWVEPRAVEVNMLLNQILESVAEKQDPDLALTKRMTNVFNRAYSLGVTTEVKPQTVANLDV
jgi:hypothetical protein